MQQETKTFDEAKLHVFMGKVVEDLATTFSSAMVLIGDKLGLYKAMAGAGPLTSAELAQKTATTERYVREWLLNQAAGGYIEYDPETGRYRLPDEHALALADEQSPVFVQGGFQIAMAMLKAEPRIAEAFRTGAGMPWGEHDPGLFVGTERFFGTLYAANLGQHLDSSITRSECQTGSRCDRGRHRMWSRCQYHSAGAGFPSFALLWL